MAFDAGTIEATLDVQRNPFDEGLRKAKKDAQEFEKRKWKATLDLEADTKAAQTKLDEVHRREDGRKIEFKLDVDKSTIAKLDQVVDNTGKTAERSGNSFARALLNPVVIQFGLLPGIAAASAAASALAMGAVVGGFAAIAVAANKENKKLKDSWKNAWSGIKDDTEALTAPLVPYLAGIANKVLLGFRKIKPELATIFTVIGPQVESLGDGVMSLVQRAMPGLTIAALNSGKAIEGLGLLMGHVGSGVSDLFTNIAYGSANAGKGADLLGVVLQKVLGVLGTLISQFSGAWASVGPQFVATFNTLMDALARFTGGGLTSFSATLNATLLVLNGVLHVIGPIAGALGTMGGAVLGLMASWKLLAGGVGLAVKAFELLRPAAIAARLAPMAAALQRASVGFGNFVMGATLSGDAGNKAESAFRKVATSVSKAANTLPILGAAILLGKDALDHFFPSADDLATELMKGGQAAIDAKGKISDYGNSLTIGGALTKSFGTSQEDVTNKIQDLRAAMTPLERAQADATAAQNDLLLATKKYGDYSPQAQTAQAALATATDKVAAAQKAAASATQDHTDRIVEQTNLLLGEVGARLNYQNSLLQLETAQKNVTDAVKKHGTASLEARDADNAYQQQLLAVVQAVGARAKAEGEAKGVTDTDAYATSAMTAEIVRLATAAGNTAPPALRQMINGLSDSQLAAVGVHREVDGAGNAVYRLPDGKTLKFPNDANAARLDVVDLHTAIDRVPTTKTTTFLLNYVRSITGPSAPSQAPGGVFPLGANAAGGMVGLGRIQRFAGGGFVSVARGGVLRGPGGGTSDSMLALVSNTEAVIRSGAARRNQSELAAINSGLRDYEKYPDTGRPPGSGGSGGTTQNFYVTSTKADPAQVAAVVSDSVSWAARGAV